MLSEERISIRVKFSKTGSLKFISHLDLARTMKSAFLRSKLPIWYTLGFNPHPKMVFSLPLSVGTASLCEFMDFYLTEKVDFGEICERLNKAFPADLRAIEAYSPSSRFCDIGWADYRINLITPIASEELAEKIKDLFYARPLKEMAPDQAEAQKAFADNLQKASRLAENLCNAVNNNF